MVVAHKHVIKFDEYQCPRLSASIGIHRVAPRENSRKKLLTPDHIFHMQRAVLLAEAILFPYFSHNAPVYMGFISCDIMVMHFNNLSFIAVSSQLFRSGGVGRGWAGGGKYLPCPENELEAGKIPDPE